MASKKFTRMAPDLFDNGRKVSVSFFSFVSHQGEYVLDIIHFLQFNFHLFSSASSLEEIVPITFADVDVQTDPVSYSYMIYFSNTDCIFP